MAGSLSWLLRVLRAFVSYNILESEKRFSCDVIFVIMYIFSEMTGETGKDHTCAKSVVIQSVWFFDCTKLLDSTTT